MARAQTPKWLSMAPISGPRVWMSPRVVESPVKARCAALNAFNGASLPCACGYARCMCVCVARARTPCPWYGANAYDMVPPCIRAKCVNFPCNGHRICLSPSSEWCSINPPRMHNPGTAPIPVRLGPGPRSRRLRVQWMPRITLGRRHWLRRSTEISPIGLSVPLPLKQRRPSVRHRFQRRRDARLSRGTPDGGTVPPPPPPRI